MHDEDARGVKKFKPTSAHILKLLVIVAFSLGSYFVWDYAFQTTEGMCVGPICIQQGDTLE